MAIPPTGTEQSVALASVPAPSAASSAAPIPPAANTTASAPARTISAPSLTVAINQFFYTAADWLSTLPASPVTEFLQGALLLVRRIVWPDYSPPTSANAWNKGFGTDDFWYRTKVDVPDEMPREWPALSGIPGAPLIGVGGRSFKGLDPIPGLSYSFDGVQGIVYNQSNETIAVRTVGVFPNHTSPEQADRIRDIAVYQTAILEPGGAASYQLFNENSLSTNVNFLSFYRFDNGSPIGEPVRFGLYDPWVGRPSTYFQPPGVDPSPSPRTGWREGEEHHDIWGSIDISAKREGDGWQINASPEYLARYQNPSNDATEDWAIFTVNVYSL